MSLIAANAHLMESLLGNWLKNSHITIATLIFCFGTRMSYIQLFCDVQYHSNERYYLSSRFS